MLVGLLAAAVSSATPTSPGDAYSQCIGQSSSNAEFAECGEVYLRRLEVALKMAWNKAYGSLDDTVPAAPGAASVDRVQR